ncbi:MAG TPA: DUF2752 domain-containing protein [Candidatus Limnocylindrales bacterium]|nr:DUF2752 domain-containing protein [Candidatus Limnocylindrales bacterium]
MSISTAGAQRSRSMLAPAGVLAGVGVAWLTAAALRLGDSGPTPCPWRTLTGLDCPFCGATRAAASLAHGDVMTALDHNALFVLVILPLAVAAWGIWAARSWRGLPAPVIANRTVLVLMGITLGWWVLRLAVPWLGSTAG